MYEDSFNLGIELLAARQYGLTVDDILVKKAAENAAPIRNDWNEYKRTKKIFDKLTREQLLLVDPEGTWEYSPVVFHRVFDKKNRGFAELYTQDDGTHEVAIAVDPKHQGKGLGKLLLQRLIEKANKNNISEIIYAPLETNTASVNLGAHFGGDPVEKTKGGNLKFIIDTNNPILDKYIKRKRHNRT